MENTVAPVRTRASAKRVEELEIYQMAYQLAVEVYQLTRSFPSEERFGLTSQLRRSIISVPANIAEGFRRESLAEKSRFMNIAQGSVEESRTFLKLARDLSLMSAPPPLRQVDQIAAALHAYRRAIMRRIERESGNRKR